MQHAALVLIVSIILQTVAAVQALRLNCIYGRRWAWWMISAAIVLMTVRRSVSLYRTLMFDNIDLLAEEALSNSAAWVSLCASVFMFAGVGLIEPIFRDLARAEAVLRDERDQLHAAIKEREIEFRMAHRVQQSLLPPLPLQNERLEIAGACGFVNETGGDLYDYFELRDGSVLVYVADVSGHGLGPAMIATQIRTYVRALGEAGYDDPGEVLDQLNQFLVKNSDSYFVTMFLAVVEPKACQFVYASAGHQAWVLDANGGTHEIDSLSPPLGISTEVDVSSREIAALAPGSLLLLTTDGVYEARSADGELYRIDRALEFVVTHRTRPALDIARRLGSSVEDFANGRLDDDLTMVVVKHLQPRPVTTRHLLSKAGAATRA